VTQPPSHPFGAARTPLDERTYQVGRLEAETWDVLIVGGGIVGAGALLDAASRGLRAALVEQSDISAGTSSRSSRLIHGGLRYLEQLQFPLVREALAERRRLLRNAPHLVTLQPLLFPIYGLPFATKAFYDAGLTLYDILGARHDGGWHTRLNVRDTLAIAPSLRTKGLRGGLRFHDAMEDDARFTLAVLRTALASDAAPLAVTRVRATGVRTDPRTGRVRGLAVQDLLSGAKLDVRARSVVDATGVWAADEAHPFASPSMRLLPSRGAHLVVPRERIPATAGLTIRVPGKIIFLVPWPDHWLIGTTDAPFEGPPDRPTAASWEVDKLLATVNETFDVGLTRADIVGTYAGLRPLIAPSGGSTVKASREHKVTAEDNGIVRIGGGKYTTYRVMARDVIDAAVGGMEDAERPMVPSATADLALIGAAPRRELDGLTLTLAADPELAAVHTEAAARLVARHGTQALEVLALGRELDLVRPLIAGRPFLEAEVAWAARHEMALSLDDVLSRRLRVAMELPDRGAATAPRVAAILGAELGWDADRQSRECAAYLAGAEREFSVPPPA
jgi:glycerol-3-phosphate dehydrogenase